MNLEALFDLLNIHMQIQPKTNYKNIITFYIIPEKYLEIGSKYGNQSELKIYINIKLIKIDSDI